MKLELVNSIIPVTIVDNFFKDPDTVREFALKQDYNRSPGHYPGYRSNRLDIVDQNFEQQFTEKIFSLFFDFNVHEVTWKVESSFQSIPSRFEEGWVHDDKSPDGWNVAGIVYLNPNPESNSGTSICKPLPDINFSDLDFSKATNIKKQFYKGDSVDIDQYRHQRDLLNSKFTNTITVENVYNRLLVYGADELHRANKFFGQTVHDSRLTLVFYARVELTNTSFPTSR